MPGKNWVLIDFDGYGESMWEETSSLYWCGGDWYADVYEHTAYNQEDIKVVTPLHRDEVEETWKRVKALYDTYRSMGGLYEQ